jgi:circadian clock protein KaiA
MSENQTINPLSDTPLSSRLFICVFLADEQLTQWLNKLLSSDRYRLQELNLAGDFLEFIENNKEQIDCLVCLNQVSLQPLLSRLNEKGILLPIVIIDKNGSASLFPDTSPLKQRSLPQESNQVTTSFYHSAEIKLPEKQIEQISTYIDLAITKFLNLAPSCTLTKEVNQSDFNHGSNSEHFLLLQQRRLAEKLKERLGYLGVYYQRNSQDFYRNLSPQQKEKTIQQLKRDYRQIVLDYFADNQQINQWIDQFVNQAFFADLSVSQILEIHMELMDEFAQQLKLEGRSEEILLDYRLVLIDIIAHLCEMYRRSIPREDIPFELLFRVD